LVQESVVVAAYAVLFQPRGSGLAVSEATSPPATRCASPSTPSCRVGRRVVPIR